MVSLLRYWPLLLWSTVQFIIFCSILCGTSCIALFFKFVRRIAIVCFVGSILCSIDFLSLINKIELILSVIQSQIRGPTLAHRTCTDANKDFHPKLWRFCWVIQFLFEWYACRYFSCGCMCFPCRVVHWVVGFLYWGFISLKAIFDFRYIVIAIESRGGGPCWRWYCCSCFACLLFLRLFFDLWLQCRAVSCLRSWFLTIISLFKVRIFLTIFTL